MQLPPPLAPWAALLEIFPRDLAHALGPLVQRLDVAIGPLRSRHAAGQGEPDGYDGLSRRGLYERLLVSEWLLAEELPDEFTRRAATGEHAFLKLARREPAQARCSVAVLDAGPGQLGAPRLAHLAALIVLARRAAAAEARFGWGVLQQPSGPLFDEVSPATVETWLGARAVSEAGDAELAAWRERAGSEIGADDVWLVGGRRLERLNAARGASLLRVEDPLEPAARRLLVRVVGERNAAQEIALELPADALCARLLRDPFGAAAITTMRRVKRHHAPQSNLLFAGYDRLLARGANHSLLVYNVPNSPRAGMAKPKNYPLAQGQIVAAGRHRKAVLAVTAQDRLLTLHNVGSQAARLPLGTYQLGTLPLDFQPDLESLFLLESGASCLCPMLWINGTLLMGLMATADGGANQMERVAERVTAAVDFPKHVLYAQLKEQGCQAWRFAPPAAFESLAVTNGLATEAIMEAVGVMLGFGGGLETINGYLLAMLRPNGQWAMLYGGGMLLLSPPSSVRVVGVLGLKDKWPTPGLVVVDADQRSISLLGRDWSHTLPRAPEPIEHVTVCPTAPRIAYATEHELMVYSVAHEAHLLRLRWEDV